MITLSSYLGRSTTMNDRDIGSEELISISIKLVKEDEVFSELFSGQKYREQWIQDEYKKYDLLSE